MNPKCWGEGEKWINPEKLCKKVKSTWEREAAESLGRGGSLQGPQGTPSSKSIKSVQIILESLQRLIKTLSYVNANYIMQLHLASLLTLVVECLFSKMRSRPPMKTVLEYPQLLGPTMKESIKQLTNAAFITSLHPPHSMSSLKVAVFTSPTFPWSLIFLPRTWLLSIAEWLRTMEELSHFTPTPGNSPHPSPSHFLSPVIFLLKDNTA